MRYVKGFLTEGSVYLFEFSTKVPIWAKNQFVHDCPMHFDIIEGKIWVQTNMTEWNVGEMLEKQGVPKSDIVLGFLAPSTRVYSDYAVA